MKLLYVMHIHWGWIKQRPQFLAEKLALLGNDVAVVYPHSLLRRGLTKNPTNIVTLVKALQIPHRLVKAFPRLKALNEWLFRAFTTHAFRSGEPEVIWITHPDIFRLIDIERPCLVVYDCMDDALSFEDASPETGVAEKDLVDRADLIFASSANLAHVLDKRYGCRTKTTLLRNALEVGSEVSTDRHRREVPASVYTVGYFGTVSSWFDLAAVQASASMLSHVRFEIIGPIDSHLQPSTLPSNIHFIGPVPHADLMRRASRFDCAIMPFKVTDLIRSVDPVKLYEYISLNVPIVSVYYPELEPFRDFVHFYTGPDELRELLEKLSSGAVSKKYSDRQRQDFLNENSWAKRAEAVGSRLAACQAHRRSNAHKA